ncbi:MAG: hypothetical protein CSA18_02955 [Deltaproteobacteria bacterium]|nr:MAG: hypothetical protein CSA18_02955 [Deltaproteobacteria bacterium]
MHDVTIRSGEDMKKEIKSQNSKLSTRTLVIFFLFITLGVFSAEVYAAAEKSQGQNHVVFEPVIVTAQKVEENVQDVPASISVFSTTEMEEVGIDTMLDIIRMSPNVIMRKTGPERVIQMRGISVNEGCMSGPTGLYVDDTPRIGPFFNDLTLYDVERVEVLKGPQGTLYGKNSLSGVINVVTRQPGNTFGGKILAGYNFYDTGHGKAPGFRLGANLSGPVVVDKLALGIAGQLESTDGYVENLFNQDDEALKEERKNLRTTLRWTPSDSLDISLFANLMDADNGGATYRFSSGPFATPRHQVNWDGKYCWDEENNNQTLRVKYRGNGFNLLSVTGRTHEELLTENDFDFTPAPTLGSGSMEYAATMFSQEFRFTSADDSVFSWLVGISGFTEDVDFRVTVNGIGMDRDTEIERVGYALFGQATYTLWEKLNLTAGIRYDYLDTEGRQEHKGMDMSGPFQAAYQGETDSGEVLPKFSIGYDINENIMAYATVSRGYLEGGINHGFASNNDSFVFLPEFIWNYEIGVKSMLLDNRLTFNLSAFYMDMKDKQVIQWLTPMVRTIENAADAHSQGIELEMRMRLFRGMELFAGYGYTQSEFDNYMASQADGSTVDYSGNSLTKAPRHTYNVGAQYRHTCGFFSRIDLMAADEFYTDVANTAKGGDYRLLNLRLGYQGERFDFIVWGENITDDAYVTSLWNYGPGVALQEDGLPRRIGVTFTYRFKP